MKLAAAPPIIIPCQPYAALAAQLGAQWGEIPVMRGIDNAGRMVEIYVGPLDTFTIVAIEPGKDACPMLFGTDATAVGAGELN